MKRKPILPLISGVSLLVGLLPNYIAPTTAYAYTTASSPARKYDVVISAYGTLEMPNSTSDPSNTAYGDRWITANYFGTWMPNDAAVRAASTYTDPSGSRVDVESVTNDNDSLGAWPIIQFDQQGQDAANGYLLIADPASDSANDFSTWVNRLNGNYNYALWYIYQNRYRINIQDKTTGSLNYYFDSFSQMVSECGAQFTSTQDQTTTSATWTDPSSGKVYNVVATKRHLRSSTGPNSVSISAKDSKTGTASITKGDGVTFTVKANLPIPSGLASNHWDAIEILNPSGQHVAWASGTGYQDSGSVPGSFTPAKSIMAIMAGGSGAVTDPSIGTYNTSNLAAGTYTAKAWVCDAVDRVSSPGSVNFKVLAPPPPPSSSSPTITLSVDKTRLNAGQTATLSYTTTNLKSNMYVEIDDNNWDNTLPGSNSYKDYSNGQTTGATTAVSNGSLQDTYSASIYDSNTGALLATSNNVSVQWVAASSPTVSLQADNNNPSPGQTVYLTASARNVPANDYIEITDMSNDNTLNGSNYYYDGTIGETSLQTSALGSAGQTVTYQASLWNYATGTEDGASTTITVSWGGGGGGSGGGGGVTPVPPPAPTISFNPVSDQSINTGSSYTLSYTTTGMQPGDFVWIVPTANGATNTWNTSGDSNQSDSFVETEYPTGGTSASVQYKAYLLDANLNVLATATSGTLDWTSPAPPPQGIIYCTPSSAETLTTGQTAALGYQTANWLAGDYVVITAKGNGSNMWQSSSDTNNSDTDFEVETPVNGNSTTVNYTFSLYNGAGVLQSTATTSVTWGSYTPTVSFSASPTNLQSGQMAYLSYSTQYLAPGDTVSITASGNGQNEWQQTGLTASSGGNTEVETPINGKSVSVTYTATVYNSSNQVLATSTSSQITWISAAPTISMASNPQTMAPGQPSTISYTVSGGLPGGDYVTVVGTGGGQMWNASGQTQTSETYQETENPGPGQTTTVDYTATIFDSSGNKINSGTLSVKWGNAWNGSISLSANPLFQQTGQASTITATTTQFIPSGYTLVIKDVSTGQTISTSSTAPEATTYTSYNSETDQFQAYLTDGYVQVGTPSSTVSVQWSAISLNANPSLLPTNNNSTLTVTTQNIPSGDYLIIENVSTGQVVSWTQSSSYTMTQNMANPSTDTYQAFIGNTTNPSNAFADSNHVTVNWYGVTLTASPSSLPINNQSTLTAQAENMPAGYVLQITDQTTGQVIAQGQAGQTTLQTFQTMNAVTTHNYVAQVIQPSNPGVPNSTVPAQPINQYVFAGTSSGYYRWNGSGWTSISGPTPLMIQFEHGGMTTDQNGNLYVAYVPQGVNPDLVVHVQEYVVSSGTWTDLGFPNVSVPQNSDPNNQNPPQPQYILAQWNQFTNSLMVAAGTWGSSYVAIWNGSGWAQVTGFPDGIEALSYDKSTGNFIYGTGGGGNVEEYVQSSNSWIRYGTSLLGADASGVTFDQNNGSVVGAAINNTPEYYSGGSWVSTPTPPGGGENYPFFTYDANTGYLWYGSWNGNLAYWTQSGGWSSLYSIGGIDGLADDGQKPWVNQGGNVEYFNGSSWVNTGSLGAYDIAASTVGGGASGTCYFPYWSFNQNLPAYIPQYEFPQTAVASGSGIGMWVSNQNSVPNGTAFFEGTFNAPSAQNVTVSMPTNPDDSEWVFLDGKPILWYGTGNGITAGTNGTSTQVQVGAGMHQVIIEGRNDCGFGGSGDNPAHVDLQVTGPSGTLLANNPSNWATTGYVTQLPQGWSSGAVGTYNWTEYVYQENSSNSVYSQQSYSVTTTAQSLQAQTAPVPIKWYNYTTPADPFTMSASPNNVMYPGGTTFQLSFTSNDANWVNTQEGGSAGVGIFEKGTMKQVVSGTWTPNSGWTLSIPYTTPGGTDLNYVAYLLDPKGNPLASSNTVEVTDQGQGTAGNSYTTMACGTNGSEIFTTYTNGTQTAQKTVPLTIANLQVDGLFNPPPAQLALPYGNTLPLANTQNGVPVYCRAQAPFDVAVQFPDITPTSVSITFSVNQGDPVDEGGDTSWTVQLRPQASRAGYWNASTIMPKLPLNDNISVTVTATDSCGSNTLTNSNFMQVNGNPEWYSTTESNP